MSSILSTRYIFSAPQASKQEQPHQDWDTVTRAAIVILWGLLIYPQLDPQLRKTTSVGVDVSRVRDLMKQYLGEKQGSIEILQQLKRHDYIRFYHQKVIPGTAIFIAVDASKMYRYFRSSVIARQLSQQLNK